MKKYKRVIKDYSIIDHQAIESYLESMAKKGFFLKSITFNLFTFTNAPPEDRTYAIRIKEQDTVFSDVKKDLNEQGKKDCLEKGWSYCCECRYFQVFSWSSRLTSEPNDRDNTSTDTTVYDFPLKPIYSSTQDFYINLRKALLPSHLVILIPVLFWLVIGILGINRLRPEILASNLSMFALLSPFILAFIFGYNATFGLFWIVDNNRRLKDDIPLHFPSYKNLRNRNRFIYIFLSIYLLIFLSCVISSQIDLLLIGLKFIFVMIVFGIISIFSYYILPKFYDRESKIFATIFVIVTAMIMLNSDGSNAVESDKTWEAGAPKNSQLPLITLNDVYGNGKPDYFLLDQDSSIFISNYVDNFESDYVIDSTYVASTYFDCKYPWVTDYVFNYYYDIISRNARREYAEAKDSIYDITYLLPVDSDKWSVDSGYYYSSLQESVYLLKDNKVFLLHVDGGIESDEMIEVIKECMNIN